MGFIATHDEGESDDHPANPLRTRPGPAGPALGRRPARRLGLGGRPPRGGLPARRRAPGAAKWPARRSADWPVDGWYRLSLADRKVEVRKAQPSNPEDADPDNSFYVRVPGTRLKEGLRPKYRFSSLILQPAVGKQYELMLGKTHVLVHGRERRTGHAVQHRLRRRDLPLPARPARGGHAGPRRRRPGRRRHARLPGGSGRRAGPAAVHPRHARHQHAQRDGWWRRAAAEQAHTT